MIPHDHDEHDEHDDDLKDLGRVLDALANRDPASLAGGECLIALIRRMAQFESVVAGAAAAFEASGAFAVDGAKTASSWLVTRSRLPEGTARRHLRLGRALCRLPHAAAAFRGGEIGSAQMSGLAALDRPVTAEALRRDEELLVEQAKTLRFESFQRCLSYFEQHADPGGSDERDEQRRARRDVSLVSSISGMWFGRMTLDPISGEIVSGELGRIESELFGSDRAEAKARLGRDPLVHELSRNASQRRADALVEMAARSASSLPGSPRPAPLLSVLVDYETLHGRICELASGTVVAPRSLLPYLDAALVERAVFGPANRVEIGARRRLFSGATRRAVELRDRRCTDEFCSRPASECQVDHIVPFDDGGLTTQENGRLLCPPHNRLAYRRWRSLDENTRQARIAEQKSCGMGRSDEPAGPAVTDRGPPGPSQ